MGDSFLDDKVSPARRSLYGRSIVAEDDLDIVVITAGSFFQQRGQELDVLRGYSDKIHNALLHQQENVYPRRQLVVCVYDSEQWMVERLEQIPRLHLFTMYVGSFGETIVRLRALLQGFGVIFKPVRNLRAMSHLNLEKYALGGLRVVTADAYDRLGLTPDKEETFAELAARRGRNGWI